MRGLEILVGLIFHSVEGCQQSVVGILKGESAIASLGEPGEETASTVNVLVDAWRNSQSWKELDRILSMAEPGEDEEFTARDLHDRLDEALKKSLSIKEEKDRSAMLRVASPPDSLTALLDQNSTSDIVGSPPPRGSGISTNSIRAIGNRSNDNPNAGSSILLQDWSQLLDIYFANTNCWIPIVLRNDAFRAAYTVSTESNRNDTNQLQLGEQACLFSMLAYARYTQCVAIGRYGSRQDLQDHFANLFAQASQLITTYESRRDVGDIQALLIFTLLHYAQGHLGLAWSFVGKAVYHAVELGLIKSGVAQSQPLDDRNKRVILSCFVLDTLMSARLHRRPYMRTTDIQSVGLLDAEGIEEWEPWRPNGFSSSELTSNPPQPSHQPARVLSTFNLLVQTSTILNDKLQCNTNDSEKRDPRESLDTFHLLQSQHRLVAQSQAQDTSPQALNLMLATLAFVPRQVTTGTEAGFCTNMTLDVHGILTRVAEGVKQQGAITLSPVADIYLHLIENRNRDAVLPLSRGALDSIRLVREIKAIYNKTWRNTNLGSHEPVQATIRNQAESIAIANAPSRVLSEGSKNQSDSRDQSSVMEIMGTAANGVGTHATRAPGAFVPLQPEG